MRKHAYNTMSFDCVAIALAELVGEVYSGDPDGYRHRANLRIMAELEAAIDSVIGRGNHSRTGPRGNRRMRTNQRV